MTRTSLLFLAVAAAACSPAAPTQPPVVVGGTGGSAGTCDEAVVNQDPFEAAIGRARCEHPDMLVHPRCYRLERVPAIGDARLYALSMSTPVDRCDLGGTTQARIASYCVAKDGRAARVERMADCH